MQNSFIDVYVLESLQSSHIWAHYLLLIVNNLCGQKQHLFRASVNGIYSYLMHLVIVIVQPLFKSHVLAFYSCSVSAYCSYYLEVHCCATCVKKYVVVKFLLLHLLQLFCGFLGLGWGQYYITCSLSKVYSYSKIGFHLKQRTYFRIYSYYLLFISLTTEFKEKVLIDLQLVIWEGHI